MVKPGYKQTEVGVIPIDWQVKTIGELGYVTSGESPSRFAFDNGNIPYFKVDQLNNSTKYQERTPYKIKYEPPVEKGSIIFPKRGAAIATNKVRILKDPSFFDTNIMSITFTSKLAHSEFFYYYLVRKELWQIADTTSVPQINNKHILPLLCPFPSLVEQERIAKALSDVDSMISSLEKLIAKKKAVKQGAMQELLTGKKRLPGFAGEWKECVLGELCYLITKQTGFDYTNEIKPALVDINSNGTLPFIQNKDFSGKKINTQTDYYIPYDVALKYPRILLDETCLLVSLSGRIGNVGLYEKSNGLSFIGGAVGICRFNKEQNAEWCMLYLQSSSGQKQIFECQKSGAQHNLTVEDVRKLVVKLPSTLEEQMAIASILSDMDNEIEALEQKLAKTRQIKQGMMQQLLTGKIRLV